MAPCHSRKFVILTLALFGICVEIPGSYGHVHEKKLLSTLFTKYKTELRPVYYPQDTLKVQLGVALSHLLDLVFDHFDKIFSRNLAEVPTSYKLVQVAFPCELQNVKDHNMIATVWIRLVWKDASLKWDEAQFGNISVLRVRPTMIWVPDLIVRNADNEHYKIPKRTNVLIYPSGEVLWVPPVMYKVSCATDSTHFPFDTQTCLMKFQSSSYNGREISFALYNDKHFADLTDYWKSDQWAVYDMVAVHNTNPAQNGVDSEEDIIFYFTFTRKITNYVITLISLSIMLAVIAILPFILPDEKSEKLILELGSLVGSVILLMHVRGATSSSWNVAIPAIAKYLLVLVKLNLVSIICTVGAIYFNITHKPMPVWLQKYVLPYLSKIFIWNKRLPKSNAAPPSAIEDTSAAAASAGAPSELNETADDKGQGQEQDKDSTDEKKWRRLALIMDRALFLIYFVIILIETCLLLFTHRRSTVNEDSIIRKYEG